MVKEALTADHRFVGRWIVWMNDSGDRSYGHEACLSKEAAQKAAIAGSRKAGVCEWIGVAEQEFDRRLGTWVTFERWTGDYDQLEPVA